MGHLLGDSHSFLLGRSARLRRCDAGGELELELLDHELSHPELLDLAGDVIGNESTTFSSNAGSCTSRSRVDPRDPPGVLARRRRLVVWPVHGRASDQRRTPARASRRLHPQPGSLPIGAVGYYTQLANGQLRVDAATAVMDGTGSGASLRTLSVTRLSPAFDLIPNNIPLPAFGPNFTTNYDRTIRPCYNIGEAGAKGMSARWALLRPEQTKQLWRRRASQEAHPAASANRVTRTCSSSGFE
jgi:hypothetical protein